VIINRRKFLGSAGGIVSLPVLDSILPRKLWAADDAPLKRFIVYYVPNGRNQDTFRPKGVGKNFELPQALAPLMPLKDYLTVLSGFRDVASETTVTCDHAKAAGPALTGMPILDGYKTQNGISIDQQMVKALNVATQFKSLQWTAAEPGVNDCGSSNIYTQVISWADAKTPLSPLTTPAAAFNQLFAGYDPASTEAQRALREATQKSVLDFVLKDVQGIQAKASKADRVKLDEYLSGVRDVEHRLSSSNSCGKEPPLKPGRLDHPNTVKAFNDLMALAIRCDMTRIITFMLEYEVSYRVYEFLFPGQGSAGHHSLSHYGNQGQLNQLIAVETWETTMFLDLAQKLKAIPEGNGNVLDNTILLLMPGMGQGANHDHGSVAMAMLGKGGGKINAGQHLQKPGEPVGNIHVSLLNAMDVKTSNFGIAGTKVVDGLLSA
jgi:hypothetical protein